MRYSSSAHTRFYHRFHVVWVTKYRYKVLQGPMRERIREIIMQTCSEMGVHIVKGVLATGPCPYVPVDPAKTVAVQRHATHQGPLVAPHPDGVP